MVHVAPFSRILAVLCLTFCGCVHAAGDDTISTDRPDFVESSQVVGRGRVQLETSVQWDRQRSDASRERTFSTPTLLRIGVGESTELRIETDGRTVVHASSSSSGVRANTAGYADSAVGVKWHLADQQDRQASLGLLLHADLPSGSRELRGHGVRPSLRLAAEWDLAQDLSFGIMPGVAVDRGDDNRRYGYGILAATVGKEFDERVRGFVELAAPQIARASSGGTQASFDTGLTYLIDKDIQADFLLMHGLNRRTPDLSVAIGLSVRM
ncbi:outer membrane putative beta-barrel porin/alpha-amylase [Herbaspirillum sp. SJZ107]|nr:outer membrane putative beta-barrel porin/alpha-amylase [Herbaspirillum sp. SJZ107]